MAPVKGVEPASAADLPDVLALLNRELGDPIYSLGSLQAVLEDETAALQVTRRPGRIAGAALSRLMVPEDLGYYARFGNLATATFASGTDGSLEALAVQPEDRRRGLGRALVAAAETWMFEAGAAAVAVVGWDSGRPDSSLSLLRALGYEQSERVERFYEAESREAGWRCPVDGNPCLCGAVLFVRRAGTTPGGRR